MVELSSFRRLLADIQKRRYHLLRKLRYGLSRICHRFRFSRLPEDLNLDYDNPELEYAIYN